MKLSDVRIKDKKDMQMSFVNITERFSGKSRLCLPLRLFLLTQVHLLCTRV